MCQFLNLIWLCKIHFFLPYDLSLNMSSLKVVQNNVVSCPCPDSRLIDVHVTDCITCSVRLPDQLFISKVIIHEPPCQMDSSSMTQVRSRDQAFFAAGRKAPQPTMEFCLLSLPILYQPCAI